MYSWQSICITYMIGLAPGNTSERWKFFCPVSFLAKLLIRVVLTDDIREKAAKLIWWSPVVVSFLGPVTILETTSSDGSAGAKESMHAFYHSKGTGESESHNDGDFVDRREKSAQGRSKTNATTTTTKEGNKGKEGRKQATRRAHAERAGPGTGPSHTPGVTCHAYMNEWMND